MYLIELSMSMDRIADLQSLTVGKGMATTNLDVM